MRARQITNNLKVQVYQLARQLNIAGLHAGNEVEITLCGMKAINEDRDHGLADLRFCNCDLTSYKVRVETGSDRVVPSNAWIEDRIDLPDDNLDDFELELYVRIEDERIIIRQTIPDTSDEEFSLPKLEPVAV